MDDIESELEGNEPSENYSEIVGWVMEHVRRWRNARNTHYDTHWKKYRAIWSGEWSQVLSTRQAERSRIIAPATQSAVDQTVAEMVEATFGRGKWFDITDSPEEQPLATQMRDFLIDDFDRDRMSSVVTDVYYNGAIYGTGIAKRIVEMGDSNRVFWEAVQPSHFVIDTAACTIDEALGCAHETHRPRHEVTDKQRAGIYFDGDVGAMSGPNVDSLTGVNGETLEVDAEDGIYITEYHGKIPVKLLRNVNRERQDEDILADIQDTDDEDEYVEAIITIANGSTLLKADENPIIGDDRKPDRGFVAYQHHKVPNQFWGMGVVEKAFNSQSALDAEVRARIDSLGLLTYPVVGADATRLPKNLNLTVTPGKVYLTNGRPSEVIEPLKFGNLDANSFQQSADFERMVQLSTGASDPSTPVNINRKNETSSGVSMQQGSYIKRAKLTMQNVDADFLDPMVRKSVWAYMAVDPQRYPSNPGFTVNSTMSIMAREFEQMQMTNLLAIIQQESPAFPIILKGIVENYSGPSKDQIIQAVDQIGKPDPEQQKMQQAVQMLNMQKLQKEVEKIQAEIEEIQARAKLNSAKSVGEVVDMQHSGQQLDIQAAQTLIANRKIDATLKQIEVQAAKIEADSKKNNNKKAN